MDAWTGWRGTGVFANCTGIKWGNGEVPQTWCLRGWHSGQTASADQTSCLCSSLFAKESLQGLLVFSFLSVLFSSFIVFQYEPASEHAKRMGLALHLALVSFSFSHLFIPLPLSILAGHWVLLVSQEVFRLAVFYSCLASLLSYLPCTSTVVYVQ